MIRFATASIGLAYLIQLMDGDIESSIQSSCSIRIQSRNWNTLMTNWHSSILVAAFAFVAALINVPNSPALAYANSVRGIVAEHCIKCHAVPGFPQHRQTRSVLAPGFIEMANKPNIYTNGRLRRFLARPHYPMGQFTLSQRNIEDLIAFINSLKSGD